MSELAEQPTEQVSAVIDRFEGQYAVLRVGDAGAPRDVRRTALPRGARAGHWLRLALRGDEIIAIALDEAATAAARLRIAEKLARLRRGDHLKPDD